MKAKEFDKLVNDTVDACKEILISKGGEYAHGDDRLDNFKRNAEQMGLTPEDVWMIYFRKHLDAITTAVKDIRMGKTRVVSEPLDGRFDDAINYLMLGKALFIDRRKK
jgi:hypothetical protein